MRDDEPRSTEHTKIRDAFERFLKTSKQPVIIEPGEEPFALDGDNFTIEARNGRAIIEVWDEDRNLVRRITGIHSEKRAAVEFVTELFGKRQGRLSLVDSARRNQTPGKRALRATALENFRTSISRQFPGWKIAELSCEPNLEASLSPVYPRAFLKKGVTGWAAIAAPPQADACQGVLTFGLIWLDYLRTRERKLTIGGLALFLPQGHDLATCLRLRFLNPRAGDFDVFVYSEDGFEEHLDPRNFGNLDTRLEPCRTATPERTEQIDSWLARLERSPHMEAIPNNDGSVSLRVRGLEIARATATELQFGLEKKRPATEANLAEVERLASEVAARREAGAEDRGGPLFRGYPERWLESQVRLHLEEIDPSLVRSPLYGQVPAFAGGDRGVLDMLAVDHSGRLAVLELKASEDIHLPLQALDYWMRVQWHLDRNEFGAHGYFPGIALRPEPPRLLLVAPALDFHPKTETILRYLSPEIEVERIGLGVEWRKRPKVMFRLTGAKRPF